MALLLRESSLVGVRTGLAEAASEGAAIAGFAIFSCEAAFGLLAGWAGACSTACAADTAAAAWTTGGIGGAAGLAITETDLIASELGSRLSDAATEAVCSGLAAPVPCSATSSSAAR